MIQRIQTIYLLIVAALNLLVVFLPLATVQVDGAFYSFDASGMSTTTAPEALVYPAWALMGLAAIISLLALATIFLFRRRMLQIRLCTFNTLLIIGFYALFAFYLWKIASAAEAFTFRLQVALVFPLVSLILNWLAIRAIGADEMLVRSLNRLRK